MKFYKTVDDQGNLVRLDKSTVPTGTEISEVEYNLLKAAIQMEMNGESAEKIAKEDWWQ